uniref:Uncharacterized protein n=1 Tax=Papaver somniferum TaxID=3469 RepID=A0A5B7LJX2_PAPSO|nr:hypothetical protein [Papaver somniferum]
MVSFDSAEDLAITKAWYAENRLRRQSSEREDSTTFWAKHEVVKARYLEEKGEAFAFDASYHFLAERIPEDKPDYLDDVSSSEEEDLWL